MQYKEEAMNDDPRLLETNRNNRDHFALLFCAAVLEKESELVKPHVSHLYLSGGYVNGTNGSTIRRAKLEGEYEDGLYRVFRKDKASAVLYMADDSREAYPDASNIFDTDEPALAQIAVTDTYWLAHAQIVLALQAKETFDASYLKGAEGVYDLHLAGRTIVLINPEFALAMAPIAHQQTLPGM
jgi:hypothetical protein